MLTRLLMIVPGLVFIVNAAVAEEVNVEAVMVPQESMRHDFKDGSKHFVLMVRREGSMKGEGLLAGTHATEFGWHDIDPPSGADPHGYLVLEADNGDVAYIKWQVRAVFFKGEDKPRLADYGHWELVSGTGQFDGKRGIGTLQIKPASPTDRLFILTGEIDDRP